MNNMKGFAVEEKRKEKALKIEAVLKDFLSLEEISGMKILDIGSGSGLIAEHFSARNDVYCVDVEDQLVLEDKGVVTFRKAEDEIIPFEDNSFDIVISNQVLEHVGDQGMHLREIKRVLKKTGVCYAATPNRNFPYDGHYRMVILHYLPARIYLSLLKKLGKYKEDVFLLTHGKMIELFRQNGFEYSEYTGRILSSPQKFHMKLAITGLLPKFFWDRLAFLSPTNIFVLNITA